MYISDELRVEGRLHSNGEIGRGTTGGALAFSLPFLKKSCIFLWYESLL
jgi:hypothetical protein